MPRATPPAAGHLPPRSLPVSNAKAPDNVPVHTIRHRSLKASIWRNDTAKGTMYKVMVIRSYKEGNQWHDTHGFGYDDLMNVAKLLADAHTWISQQRAQDNAAEESGADAGE